MKIFFNYVKYFLKIFFLFLLSLSNNFSYMNNIPFLLLYLSNDQNKFYKSDLIKLILLVITYLSYDITKFIFYYITKICVKLFRPNNYYSFALLFTAFSNLSFLLIFFLQINIYKFIIYRIIISLFNNVNEFYVNIPLEYIFYNSKKNIDNKIDYYLSFQSFNKIIFYLFLFFRIKQLEDFRLICGVTAIGNIICFIIFFTMSKCYEKKDSLKPNCNNDNIINENINDENKNNENVNNINIMQEIDLKEKKQNNFANNNNKKNNLNKNNTVVSCNHNSKKLNTQLNYNNNSNNKYQKNKTEDISMMNNGKSINNLISRDKFENVQKNIFSKLNSSQCFSTNPNVNHSNYSNNVNKNEFNVKKDINNINMDNLQEIDVVLGKNNDNNIVINNNLNNKIQIKFKITDLESKIIKKMLILFSLLNYLIYISKYFLLIKVIDFKPYIEIKYMKYKKIIGGIKIIFLLFLCYSVIIFLTIPIKYFMLNGYFYKNKSLFTCFYYFSFILSIVSSIVFITLFNSTNSLVAIEEKTIGFFGMKLLMNISFFIIKKYYEFKTKKKGIKNIEKIMRQGEFIGCLLSLLFHTMRYIVKVKYKLNFFDNWVIYGNFCGIIFFNYIFYFFCN